MSKQRAVSLLARIKRCKNIAQVRKVLDSVEPQESLIIAAAYKKLLSEYEELRDEPEHVRLTP